MCGEKHATKLQAATSGQPARWARAREAVRDERGRFTT